MNKHDVNRLYWSNAMLLNCRAHANIHIAVIRCIFSCCCHTAVRFCCVYFVTERNACNIYLHVHPNAAQVRMHFALKSCVSPVSHMLRLQCVCSPCLLHMLCRSSTDSLCFHTGCVCSLLLTQHLSIILI